MKNPPDDSICSPITISSRAFLATVSLVSLVSRLVLFISAGRRAGGGTDTRAPVIKRQYGAARRQLKLYPCTSKIVPILSQPGLYIYNLLTYQFAFLLFKGAAAITTEQLWLPADICTSFNKYDQFENVNSSAMASTSAIASRISTFRKPLFSARAARCKQLTSVRTVATRATQYTLNTGAKIPALGFGTFQDPESQEDTVCQALQKGMRLIDTARVYNVEEQVGKGIKKSGIPREDIFLGTKLWCNDYHPDDVERALDDSLRDLNTPYVDLMLMHYPCTFAQGPERFPRDENGRMIHGKTTFVDTWKAMEEVTKTGKVKAIGVSNFSKSEIETLLEKCTMVGRVWISRITQKANCRFRSQLSIKWKPIHICSRRLSING